MAISEKNLQWRRRQKRGAIMKPETFQAIVSQNVAKGLSAEKSKKIAGKAYWKTEKSKFKVRKKK